MRKQDLLEIYIQPGVREDQERKEEALDDGYKLHSVTYDNFQHKFLYIFYRESEIDFNAWQSYIQPC